MAGVNVGNDSSESKTAQEIMQSWSFIEGFITENNISVEVYAAQKWNRESDELQIDSGIYDSDTKTWLLENNITGEVGPPSSWKLFESFSQRLEVSEYKKTDSSWCLSSITP